MAAATVFTYDDSPARRPDVEDLGGTSFEDDPNEAPNMDGTELYAAVPNQQNALLAGLAGVCPVAIVSLVPSGGTMVVDAVKCVGSTLSASDFTVLYSGVGDFRVTWASGALPPLSVPPTVHVHSELTSAFARGLIHSATSVRVLTVDHANSPVDVPVSAHIL